MKSKELARMDCGRAREDVEEAQPEAGCSDPAERLYRLARRKVSV
jgi:hypothetical protein